MVAGASAVTAALPRPAAVSRATDYLTLARVRLNVVVVATAAVSYALAVPRIDGWRLAAALIGTGLVAGGASAANQLLERATDRRMRRTCARPLAAGRLSPMDAVRCAGLLTAGGSALLASASLLAAAIAAVTWVAYVVVYTPLKRLTPWALVIGALPGAAPTLIGWSAARGALTVEAWALFAILFCWQVPHFLAIAWLYRDDYARASIEAFPVRDPGGRSTAALVVVCSAALVAASALPGVLGMVAPAWSAAAVALTAAFAGLGVSFARRRGPRTARRLFAASLVHLVGLWILLILGSR